MNKKIIVIYIIILLIWLALMIWCFCEKEYKAIISSISLIIGIIIGEVIIDRLWY